jgi:EpsI family protein
MNVLRIKAVVALLLMVVAFAVAAAWKPTMYLADSRPKVDLETLFPKQFGEWSMDTRMPAQLVSPDQAAVLNAIYSQTLSRSYVNKQGHRVMLSVAYGGDQSDATRAHRPEVCYPAQGFQILSSAQDTLSTPSRPLRVRQLVARQGGRIEPITYWIIVGDKITLGGSEQKLAQLSYSVRGVIPDGMLVRVSTIDSDSKQAFAIHEAFISDMSTAMRSEDLPQVIGTAKI